LNPEYFLVASRTMKPLLLLLAFLPLTVPAQHSADQYSRQRDADNIVAFFIGDEIFQRYVKLDTRETRKSSPNTVFFQYNFQHPKFSGETFVIAFTLDSAGQFIPGKETRGLIHIGPGSDSAWITARQALRIARNEGHRIKKNSLRLEWDPTDVSYDNFEKTRDFRDIIPGDIVWKIDGVVMFRGDPYSGTFNVNVLTGQVARRFAIPWD
jgi:hypothetical protein